MPGNEPLTVWRETVRPEWTDYNGHMNVAYFVLVFDHATDAFLATVGLGEAYRARTNCSTFAVEGHITYEAELLAGEEVLCTTQLLGFDHKRLHFFHRMQHAGRGHVAATTELMAVHVDLAARRSTPMPDDVQHALAALLERHAGLPRPEQVGRVMRIPAPRP